MARRRDARAGSIRVTVSLLPGRLMNRVSFTLARHRLETDFAALMRTAAPRDSATGPIIGVAAFSSGWHFVLEALLAHALAARGARPELLVCDLPELPICDERTIHSTHRERCDGCIDEKRPLLDHVGLPWRGISALIADGALERARHIGASVAPEEIAGFVERGFPIGGWLHVSACHYLRCDARGDTADRIETRRRLLIAAIVLVEATERWLDDLQPDIVIAESGAHFEWRIVRELARARGIAVVCREIGKGGFDTHLYSLNADCMAPDLSAAWAEAKDQPLSETEDAAVDRFLSSLPQRTYEQRAPIARAARAALRSSLGVHAGVPVAVAFTNVAWDLATAGRDRTFDGQLDWLRETVRALDGRAAHLVIRTHPAEATALTRERVGDTLIREFPHATPHVTIVGPEDTTAARDLCAAADLVLAYNSHAAIEAAALGHPVIVAGDAHFRGRGFTIDVDSREAYLSLLREWAGGTPLPPPPASAALARRYCHLFFLRYHVTMNWTTSPLAPPYRLTIQSLRELEPGRNPVVDAVCSAILNRQQVLLPRATEGRA